MGTRRHDAEHKSGNHSSRSFYVFFLTWKLTWTACEWKPHLLRWTAFFWHEASWWDLLGHWKNGHFDQISNFKWPLQNGGFTQGGIKIRHKDREPALPAVNTYISYISMEMWTQKLDEKNIKKPPNMDQMVHQDWGNTGQTWGNKNRTIGVAWGTVWGPNIYDISSYFMWYLILNIVDFISISISLSLSISISISIYIIYVYIYMYIYIYIFWGSITVNNFEPPPLEPLIWDPGTPGPFRPGMSPVTAGGRLSLQLNSVGGTRCSASFFLNVFFVCELGKINCKLVLVLVVVVVV